MLRRNGPAQARAAEGQLCRDGNALGRSSMVFYAGATARLAASMTWASIVRAFSQRASHKPSRPVSKATAMVVVLRPASASPRHLDAISSSARPIASLIPPLTVEVIAVLSFTASGPELLQKLLVDHRTP